MRSSRLEVTRMVIRVLVRSLQHQLPEFVYVFISGMTMLNSGHSNALLILSLSCSVISTGLGLGSTLSPLPERRFPKLSFWRSLFGAFNMASSRKAGEAVPCQSEATQSTILYRTPTTSVASDDTWVIIKVALHRLAHRVMQVQASSHAQPECLRKWDRVWKCVASLLFMALRQP